MTGRTTGMGAVCALALLAAPAQAEKVFISNEKGNTVTVLDSETLEVTDTIDVGQRPRGITLAEDGKHLLVAVGDDDTVEVYDTDTHEFLHTLPSGPDPELFVLHPSGNPLYIANEDDNLVTVVDLETRQPLAEIPVGVEPEGMGVSPDGSVIVNTSETTNMAHFIDAESHEIVANVLVDQRPRFAEFKPDGSEVWVSSEIGGTVSVIDPEAHEVVHKIEFEIPGIRPESIQPVGVRITGDGKTAFVALGPSNRVAVVNAETYEVEDYLLVGQRVWQLAFSPDESLLFTTNGVSNDVSVIDVEDREVVKSIPRGGVPLGRRGAAGMREKRMRMVIVAAAVAVAAGGAHAQAGLLTGGAEELAPITLASGQPLADAPYELKAGRYYELTIQADGSAELAIGGADFFRNVWVDEIVINDIEVRPLGVESLEFDDEGEAVISFVTIRPGRFTLSIPGTTGETQQAVFNVTD